MEAHKPLTLTVMGQNHSSQPLSKTQKQYFAIAQNISKLSTYPKYQIGCIVVYKHRVISSGYNGSKTNPLQKQLNIHRYFGDFPAKIHAEVSALLPLIGLDLTKADIYVFRCHKNQELATAKPCKSCMALIQQLNIRNIYYTIENGYAQEKM